jgi:hypothetical protein
MKSQVWQCTPVIPALQTEATVSKVTGHQLGLHIEALSKEKKKGRGLAGGLGLQISGMSSWGEQLLWAQLCLPAAEAACAFCAFVIFCVLVAGGALGGR